MVSGLRESFEKIKNAREVAETAEKTKAEFLATRIKSRFLANMSHELRMPMDGMIRMTQLPLHTKLHTSPRYMLDTVRTQPDTQEKSGAVLAMNAQQPEL